MESLHLADEASMFDKDGSSPAQSLMGWLRKARTTAARWLAPDSESPSENIGYRVRADSLRSVPASTDSTQFGITCEGTFAPDAWGSEAMVGMLAKEGEDARTIRLATGAALTAQLKAEFERGWALIAVTPPPTACLPTISGKTRVYESFRPQKLIINESLVVTFTNAELGSTNVAVELESAGDLVLISTFVGARNCFPMAPNPETGLSGRAFSANGLGNGLDWPVAQGGIDIVSTLVVKPTVLYRATPPEGYTAKDLARVHVQACLNLFGSRMNH